MSIDNPQILSHYFKKLKKKHQITIVFIDPINTELNEKYVTLINENLINEDTPIFGLDRGILKTYSSILITKFNTKPLIIGYITSTFFNEGEEREFGPYKFNLYIDYIELDERFRGMGLCYPLFNNLISNLKNIEKINNIYLSNAAGLAGCSCYVKSGVDNNYSLMYEDLNEDKIKDMSYITPPNPVKDFCKNEYSNLSTNFYFIKEALGGSSKRKKTKTKKTKKTKKNKYKRTKRKRKRKKKRT